MWTGALRCCIQILDKFEFQIYLWITLKFKTIYTQLYPEVFAGDLTVLEKKVKKKPG